MIVSIDPVAAELRSGTSKPSDQAVGRSFLYGASPESFEDSVLVVILTASPAILHVEHSLGALDSVSYT